MADIRKARMEPVGITSDKQYALGGFDELRKNMVFGIIPASQIPRFAIDLMNHWYDTPMTHKQLDAGLYLSDTGELARDCARGILTIDTPTVQAIQGTVTTGTRYETPSKLLGLVSQSPFAVAAVISLDGEPLESSRLFDVKMVTVAENRKQLLEPSHNPKMPGLQVMTSEGSTPIITNGRPLEDRATHIVLKGREIIGAYAENGVWEALFDLEAKTIYLSCDIPNTQFTIDTPEGEKEPESFTMQAYYNEKPAGMPTKAKPKFVYPTWAKYVALKYE
jgi:hypothetical protein